MKKFATIMATLLAVVLMFSLVACGGGENEDLSGGNKKPGATVTLNKTELVLEEGATERLTATTDPANEGVTFASSDDEVASVSASGLVSALGVGTATITATVESSGNTATCSVTVNAQPVPALPTGETGFFRVDQDLDFERNKSVIGSLTIKRDGGVTTISYDETAAQDLTWQNWARLLMEEDMDVSRKTDVSIMIKGGGEAVWFKLLSKSGVTIMEQEITAGLQWVTYDFKIPEGKRYLLSELEGIYVNVPRPNASNSGSGSVQIAGVWFTGDAEPTEEVVYNYSDYESIAALDLSIWNDDAYSEFDENGVATDANGKTVTGTYDAEKDELKFVNNGVNEWKKFNIPLPAADYSEAAVLVICATGTEGMHLKGQVNYGNDFEFVNFDGTKQYYFVDISELTLTVAEGAPVYVTLVPSYLFGGATSSEITIHSVEIMKLK